MANFIITAINPENAQLARFHYDNATSELTHESGEPVVQAVEVAERADAAGPRLEGSEEIMNLELLILKCLANVEPRLMPEGVYAQAAINDYGVAHAFTRPLSALLRAGDVLVTLSCSGTSADIVRALDAGANDYVVKPFQPAELKARIRRLVAGP